MRSVILISSNIKEVECLFQQWENKATNVYFGNNELSMDINGEGIYVDYLENGIEYYEDDEILNIKINKPLFYSICYSNREIMKYFIQESDFSQGSYLDNDLGRIVLIDELRKEEILNFIQ